MTDPFAEGAVHEQGDGAPFVIRLSKTARGERTYTIGASLGRDETPEAVVDALFEVERLVIARMGKPDKAPRPEAMMTQLRRSVLVEQLRKVASVFPTEWVTTADLTQPGMHRSQVVNDLKALVAEGVVEYERGKGGNYPSRYRLAAGAQKGAKA